MDYALATFDGAHYAHIAAYFERKRLAAIDKRNRECFNSNLRYRNRNRAYEERQDAA